MMNYDALQHIYMACDVDTQYSMLILNKYTCKNFPKPVNNICKMFHKYLFKKKNKISLEFLRPGLETERWWYFSYKCCFMISLELQIKCIKPLNNNNNIRYVATFSITNFRLKLTKTTANFESMDSLLRSDEYIIYMKILLIMLCFFEGKMDIINTVQINKKSGFIIPNYIKVTDKDLIEVQKFWGDTKYIDQINECLSYFGMEEYIAAEEFFDLKVYLKSDVIAAMNELLKIYCFWLFDKYS